MIADVKPYPRMRQSGVVWVGKIPEHWETERAKWLFRKMDRPVRDEDEVVTCFRDGTVTLRKNRRLEGFTESLKEVGYQGIRRGDLVIHGMDAAAGAAGVSDADGKGTPVYSVCRPSLAANAHYYAFAVREMARTQWIQALAKGIRERSTDFRYGEFATQLMPLPPLAEQAAIARFLIQADRRIQQYVHAKQKMIKLLDERRQVLIDHAVTRGLDSNSGLKPLGSAPSAEVNERWPVARLGEVSQLRSEKNRADLDLLSVFLGRGVILYGEGGGQVHKPSLDLAGYQVVHPGDLVLNNQQAWRGSVGVSRYRGIISPAYVVLRLADSLDCLYADYLFRSRAIVEQFVTSSKGVGDIQRDIHAHWLKNVRLPIPPIEEQRAITTALDGELTDISRQSSLIEREAGLVREYRSRLISDVVTGKVDIRAAVTEVSDEVEETAPLDGVDTSVHVKDDLDVDPDEVVGGTGT